VYYIRSTHRYSFSHKRSASLRSSDGGESILPETPVQSSKSSLKRVKHDHESESHNSTFTCIFESYLLSPATMQPRLIPFLASIVSILRRSVVIFITMYLFCYSDEEEHDKHSTPVGRVSPSKRT
jgi:hypothetical protein